MAKGAELKPRIVVLTDIGPSEWEPDDTESMIRLLAHADLFEIEALIATSGWNSSGGLYDMGRKDTITTLIDAYARDVNNLMRRSEQKKFKPLAKEERQEIGYWPSAEYLHSRTMAGSRGLGLSFIGAENNSAGSDYIIKLADEDDPRPIYIGAWGGANTLAQAIWKVKNERSEPDFKKFLSKIRLYTITDQDVEFGKRGQYDISSHKWIREVCGDDLLFVWDESAWLVQNSEGKANWNKYAEYVQGHGELGKHYPKYKYGVEGDTPSFLYVIPNGLSDPDNPSEAGWGGWSVYGLSHDGKTKCYTNKENPIYSISWNYAKYFYPATFNEFAARMQWVKEGDGNLNPVVKVKQNLKGNTLILDASKSYDPDGDSLSYKWWAQGENGMIVLGTESTLTVEANKYSSIVCEIHDDGEISLVGYKRIYISE